MAKDITGTAQSALDLTVEVPESGDSASASRNENAIQALLNNDATLDAKPAGGVTDVTGGDGITVSAGTGSVTIEITDAGVGTPQLTDDGVDATKLDTTNTGSQGQILELASNDRMTWVAKPSGGGQGSSGVSSLTAGNAITISSATGAVTVSISNGDIGTSEIADDSITEAKIAQNAVTGVEIANRAVASQQLASQAVTAAKIGNGAVGTTQLADDSVTQVKVDAGAIGTTEITDDAITQAKIASGAVGTTEIADDAVDSDQIATNAVISSKIPDGSIASSKLASNSVDSSKIVSGEVGTSELSSNAVTAVKIADGAVNETKLDITNTGTVGQILELASNDRMTWVAKPSAVVGVSSLTGGTAITVSAATGAVTISIANGAIGPNQLAADSVTNAKIAASAVGTTEIANNAITSGKLASNSVGASEISNGAVGTTELASDSVTNAKVANGAIDTEHLASDAVTNAKLADDAVDSDQISDGAVDETKLDITNTGTVGQILELASNDRMTWVAKPSGGTGAVADGSITTVKLADNAVTNDKIADGNVGNAQLANNDVTESKLRIYGSPPSSSQDGYVLSWNNSRRIMEWVDATSSDSHTHLQQISWTPTIQTGIASSGITFAPGSDLRAYAYRIGRMVFVSLIGYIGNNDAAWTALTSYINLPYKGSRSNSRVARNQALSLDASDSNFLRGHAYVDFAGTPSVDYLILTVYRTSNAQGRIPIYVSGHYQAGP